MSTRHDNAAHEDEGRDALDLYRRNSKTRRQRLKDAKASFDRLFDGGGERVANADDDAGVDASAMFEAEPTRPPTPDATQNDQPGVQIPAFRAADDRSTAAFPPVRKRKRRLRSLLRGKRKKIFF